MLYDVNLELYIHMANANYEMSAQTPNFFELDSRVMATRTI